VTMSKATRNKLSAAACGGMVFCAVWLLVSAQAAVQHVQQQSRTSNDSMPAWTVKTLIPDTAN